MKDLKYLLSANIKVSNGKTIKELKVIEVLEYLVSILEDDEEAIFNLIIKILNIKFENLSKELLKETLTNLNEAVKMLFLSSKNSHSLKTLPLSSLKLSPYLKKIAKDWNMGINEILDLDIRRYRVLLEGSKNE